MKLFSFLKDILAPKKCYSCNKEWHFLCNLCMTKIQYFEPICYSCKWRSDNFEVHQSCKNDVFYDKVIILSHYKNKIISKLIKDLKFYWKKDIGEDFWEYLAELFFENEIYQNTDNYRIIFPPMNFFRKIKKWYNQSEILAQNVSKFTKIKLETNIIKKIKKTRQQAKLWRKQRLTNLQNAFKINKKYIDKIDKTTYIFVDDVISTWTTLNEISKILRQAWAKRVIWLIIASD